ncbi:MAG TPA: hypothetical protein VMS21_11045 [Methylomirabilota bacterium]|nr:hypothetical protein [Methylomirabilota bacterium]
MNRKANKLITWEDTLATAARGLREFEALMREAPYEAKGVLFSEMLFVRAAAGNLQPRTVFESGRAGGVSTFLLSRCFPEKPVVSIELNADSPDVELAARNLRGLTNVQCLFGDARRLLLDRVQPGDLVIIDGPKHHRALRLALRLLWRRRPAAVFIHDCYRGSIERRLLETRVPGCLFSDSEEFVERYRGLDAKCWEAIDQLLREGGRVPHLETGKGGSYGPTFACVPYDATLPFRRLLVRVRLDGHLQRWRKAPAVSGAC